MSNHSKRDDEATTRLIDAIERLTGKRAGRPGQQMATVLTRAAELVEHAAAATNPDQVWVLMHHSFDYGEAVSVHRTKRSCERAHAKLNRIARVDHECEAVPFTAE